MTTTGYTPLAHFKIMSTIHLFMLIGLVIFGAVVFYTIHETALFSFENIDQIFLVIALITSIMGVFGSNYMFRQGLNNIKKTETLKEKLTKYQTTSIIRYALVEGPSLLAIVFSLIEDNLVFLSIGGLLIVYFSTLKPTVTKVVTDLQLSRTEAEQL